MSLSETTARKDYAGNASRTDFPYTWRITDQAHLEVLVDGVVQTLSTDYTVSGVDAAAGGTVTFTTPPADQTVVTLLRKQPLSQLSDYVLNEAHPSDRIEKDLDKVVMALQQDRETLTRALRAPKAAVGVDGTLPALTDQAGKVLAVNAGEDGFEYVTEITGVVNPMAGEGDQIEAGPAGAPRRLPKGTNVTLVPPTGFGWTPPVLPRYTPHGWRGDVALRTLRPALGSVAYYVDVLHGSSTASGRPLTITGITQANPAVVTYSGSIDPTAPNQVYLNDVAGMTEVNHRWFTVANVNTGAKTFELSGIDSTGFTAYTSGGTATEPLLEVAAAVAKADATVLYLAPGRYNRVRDWGATTPGTSNASLALLPWAIRSGPVQLGLWWEHTATAWENDRTFPTLWKATRSNVQAVRDYRHLTADGEAWPYELAQSASDSSARRGTYYADGTSLWVHPFDDGLPGDALGVFLSESGAAYTSDKVLYLEGLEFHGGNHALSATNVGGATTAILYAKDCKFLYGYGGNGLTVLGLALVILENCEAAFNALDGFNYHAGGGSATAPNVVEITCRGHHNGRTRTGINNGSTQHDDGRIVRIGGAYRENEGPNVADVDGAASWNVGTRARNSRMYLPGAASRADFYTDGGEMWLFDCTGDGSEFSVTALDAGTVHVDRSTERGTRSESTGGTVAAYTQG